MAEVRLGDGPASIAAVADVVTDFIEERTGLSLRFPEPDSLGNRVARVTTHGIRSTGAEYWTLRIEPKDGGEADWIAVSSSGQATVVTASSRSRGGDESLLESLSGEFVLLRDGIRLVPRPLMVSGIDGVASLVRLIRAPSRKLPVVVVSLPEHSYDPHSAALCPYALSRQLLGTAHVIVISGDDTFVLTESLGKELSVFRAAVRVYKPTQGEPLEPRHHPIIFPTSPDGRDIGSHMAERVISVAVPSAILPHVPTFRDIVSMEGNSLLACGEREAFMDDADEFVEISALRRRLAEARSLLARRSSELIKAEARIRELEGRGAPAPPSDAGGCAGRPLPRTLDEVALLAATELNGKVLLAKKAMKAMKASPYAFPVAAYRALEILAREYRTMRIEGGADREAAFAGALQEARLENMPIPPRIRSERKTLGALTEGGRSAEWHLRSSGNPNDPTKCLRVYYFWDADRQAAVVTHMPGYLG